MCDVLVDDGPSLGRKEHSVSRRAYSTCAYVLLDSARGVPMFVVSIPLAIQ